MSDRSNAFRVGHSRACLAREESRNSEGKLLWCITTPARAALPGKAQMRDSRAPGSHAQSGPPFIAQVVAPMIFVAFGIAATPKLHPAVPA